MLIDYLKTLPQYLLPKHALTAFAGLLAEVKNPAIKNALIRYFIQKYHVNMQEALEPNPDKYPDFNHFFIRQLKPECRPIAQADIISPVDGYISELGTIEQGSLLQAKGRYYTVQELLHADAATSALFHTGRFATLYLSPKDYHRVHMPITALLKSMIYVPGQLFSVQPTTARVIPNLFTRNKRLVVFFDTTIGQMAMVLVGATIVGAIGTSWSGDVLRGHSRNQVDYSSKNILLQQAEEMGYFKLGSTVILLFANHQQTQWRTDLCAGKPIRFGEPLGKIIH